MRAIAVHLGTPNSIHLREIAEPNVSGIAGGRGVKVKVLRVGEALRARGKRERDARTAAGTGLAPDATALSFDEAACDREAQPGAFAGGAGVVGAPEAVEHPPLGFGREPFPVV